MSRLEQPLAYQFAPRPDLTAEEARALAPVLALPWLPAWAYYVLGSEGRHLLVGPALQEWTRRN